MPVSSASSRTTASASVSPPSTRPPGTDHSPAAGPRPRRISSSWSSSTAMAPTQTSGRIGTVPVPLATVTVVEAVVDHQHPGGEAERLEEVLRCPHAGQRNGVGAEAAALPEPGRGQIHERLANPDTTGPGLDEDVLDHAQPA